MNNQDWFVPIKADPGLAAALFYTRKIRDKFMSDMGVKQFIDSGITSNKTPSKRFTKFRKVGRSDQTGTLRSCQEEGCAGRAESRRKGKDDGSRKVDYYSNGVDTDYRYSHSQSPSNDLSRKQSQRCVLKVNHLRHL